MEYSLSTAVYAVLIAFVVNIVLCPIIIPHLIKLKFGQYVRDDGPKDHIRKAGTPTMGGIMIIISFILAALLFLQGNQEGMALVLVTLGFGVIGFLDDFIKITKRRSMGLRAYQKMLAQIVVTVGFVAYCFTLPGFSTYIAVPFVPNVYWNLGMWYAPLACFIILGAVNGANFTDGLDGLNAGVTALIVAFFLFVAWSLHSPVLPIAGAAVGSLLGFLLFNAHPAKVFMGDTGSLALGGFVAAIAILLGMPLWLGIVALVYVVEVLSVIIQVGYFKLTGGKRFFKMAPIHHTFELSGWAETKVVAFFYIVTTILCLIGYLAFS
ncbi:MAG: phospho-N-acetylmuramoyl-pentapeptide-transferase [Defluviitaleaceae bacterium]|nr:phospho-N-acetylmuramoyl-pentapeptide-transferase [Defluviitaleaceae bacterium]